MLQTLSKYIFFILIISFFSVLYLKIFGKNFSINTNFLYLFGILILPFFDKIIELIKEDFSFYFKNFDSKKFKKNLFFRIFVLIFLTIIILFLNLEIINFLILEFIAFSLIFKLDSRISFLIALFLLIYTVLFIILGDKKIAETTSIYAYYFLIIGVGLEITTNLFFNEQKNEK